MKILLATSDDNDNITILLRNQFGKSPDFKEIDVFDLYECYEQGDQSPLKDIFKEKSNTRLINRIHGIPEPLNERIQSTQNCNKFEFELFLHRFLEQFGDSSARPSIYGTSGMPGNLISMWTKVLDTDLNVPRYYYHRDIADAVTDFDQLESQKEIIYSDPAMLYTWKRGQNPRPERINFWIERPAGVPVQVLKVYEQISILPLQPNFILGNEDRLSLERGVNALSRLFKQNIFEALLFLNEGGTTFGMWSNRLYASKAIAGLDDMLLSGIFNSLARGAS